MDQEAINLVDTTLKTLRCNNNLSDTIHPDDIPIEASLDTLVTVVSNVEQKSREDIAANPKVFVRGLNFETQEPEFEELFIKFGPLEEARIAYDRETGLSRGFGFITYTEPQDAIDAIKELNQSVFMGRTIYVTESIPTKPPKNNFGATNERGHAGSNRVCFHWLKGRCNYGDACHFRHQVKVTNSGVNVFPMTHAHGMAPYYGYYDPHTIQQFSMMVSPQYHHGGGYLYPGYEQQGYTYTVNPYGK